MKKLKEQQDLRQDWLQIVDKNLEIIPDHACFIDLKHILDIQRLIGEGNYGKIYRVHLHNSTYPYPIVLKTVTLFSEKEYATAIVEVIAMTYANALVKLSICPHFPLYYRAFVCNSKSPFKQSFMELNILEEFSQGNLQTYAKLLSVEKTVSCTFQVCIGILSLIYFTGLVNNDLSLTNILYNSVLLLIMNIMYLEKHIHYLYIIFCIS